MKTVLIVSAIVLSACSMEVGGTGKKPSGTEQLRGLQGGDQASLADTDGADAMVDAEDMNSPDAMDAVEVDAGGLIEDPPMTPDAGEPAGDSGSAGSAGTAGSAGSAGSAGAAGSGVIEPPALTRDLFVGSWSKVSDVVQTCGAQATLDSTPCKDATCTEIYHVYIDADFMLSYYVWFVRWDGDVWFGESSAPCHSSLRLRMIDENTLLGDYSSEGSGAGPCAEPICKAWRLVRN